ncbi:MAG: type II secretion system F family protein [Candidatus Aenigmatarchaeota archaeon]
MGFYSKISFRYFSQFSESIADYFGEVKANLRRAKMGLSVQEYISIAVMSCFLVFIALFPVLSFLFGFVFKTFLFSFMSSFTVSLGLAVWSFLFIMNYPSIVIAEKTRKIDNILAFALLYLSTAASSKLPLHKAFGIFAKFSEYGELTNEVKAINNDVEVFGLDINTALERAIDRSPSKAFKETLWGLLSTMRSGGDVAAYLRETAANNMAEYRRKLYEFSHQLTIYIEIYLTTIVLGAIFFTILTSIISGISQSADTSNIIMLQFFLIFVFMPLVSALFIIMIKSITPGEE